MELEEPKSLQHAVQQGADGRLHLVNTADIPSLLPGYVLVKTFAVALNPSDHKIANNFPLPGAFIGADFSGSVVSVADNVNTSVPIEEGTMVSGAAFTFAQEHRRASGAFAQYVRARADLLLRVPPRATMDNDGIGLIEAATLGTAIGTCVLALWSTDSLCLSGTPEQPLPAEHAAPVLVYGGSTATGTIAVQLLRLSGYDPIATCSPSNFDLVRGRGASAVFDYAEPDVAARIQLRTNGRLKYVLDCISDANSVVTCYDAIQRPGGRYASLEVVPDELLARRRAVRHSFVLGAEVYGEEVRLGRAGYDRPADEQKHKLAVRYTKMIQRLLDQGRLRAHPVDVLAPGLQGVLQGLEFLAAGGQASGKKLVAVIDKS
ncbi:GroES-like protein [Xylaria grammica]|nr:GroES-like protein [Xylaria grammica]